MNQRRAFKFNLYKLRNLAKDNSIKMVEILEEYYKGFRYDLKGTNFLINPGQFFFDRNTDILFKAQYIELAGRRNYQQYRDLGHTFLDLTYYPDLNINTLKYNPILTIENNKIYFKYEE